MKKKIEKILSIVGKLQIHILPLQNLDSILIE